MRTGGDLLFAVLSQHVVEGGERQLAFCVRKDVLKCPTMLL